MIIALLTVAIENSDAAARQAAKAEAAKAQPAAGETSQENAAADESVTEAGKLRTWKTRLEELSFERSWDQKIEARLKTENPDWSTEQLATAAAKELKPQFNLLGVGCFALLAVILFLISLRK